MPYEVTEDKKVRFIDVGNPQENCKDVHCSKSPFCGPTTKMLQKLDRSGKGIHGEYGIVHCFDLIYASFRTRVLD